MNFSLSICSVLGLMLSIQICEYMAEFEQVRIFEIDNREKLVYIAKLGRGYLINSG